MTLKLALAVALFAWPAAVQAQRSDSVTFELTMGGVAGVASSRDYENPGQVVLDVAIGFRSHPDAAKGLVSAIAGGTNFVFANGDKCRLNATLTACLPQLPAIAHLALVAGLEYRRSANSSARAMIGPAFFTGSGRSGAGARSQVDLAAGSTHFQLTGVFRTLLVGRFDGARIAIHSISLGFRVQ